MSEDNNRWKDFNLVIDTLNLDIKEKGLLLIIFRYVNYKNGYANPSRTLLKKLTGISDNRTLDKILDSIIEKGFLIREKGKGRRSKYFVKVGGEITPSVKNAPSGEITPSVGGEITPIVGGEITPQKENKKKTKEKIYMELTFIDDVIDKVKITKEQYEKLCSKYSNSLVDKQILALDNYIANGKGSKYKDHYKALNTWCNGNNKEATKVFKSTGDDFDY
ncbi:helix-turn-helix domain-containing protein [Clostridium diolis]|uniref:Helix-turn-helix domain-containing protein n=1 Tax=Clostridium diolis TaxID=223919 RepID=A0AAV3W990_9CLOT|nr:helix-turn-helix domain-containing protein [Clostridium diolis]QES71603.1 helix-turn-helix domain-containing protein [Clostridium diolis]GEA33604.1 hypothetical protein CDIOL_45270 [Clostridium diolis]